MERNCCRDEGCGRASGLFCGDEYIVEKVIGRFRQSCCYRGQLVVEQSEKYCPPLCLKRIEVADIAPICTCGLCACGMQRLCLTLMLFMIDGRGCPYQTQTQIEAEVRDNENRPNVGLKNVRRGARVCIKYAQYCPQIGFDAELLIEIETLVTRLEMMGNRRDCAQDCPRLPLYPPPPRPKGECSCGWLR